MIYRSDLNEFWHSILKNNTKVFGPPVSDGLKGLALHCPKLGFIKSIVNIYTR